MRTGLAWYALAGLLTCLGSGRSGATDNLPSGAMPDPLRIVVMDPLALPLSCTCAPGTGQRRYDELDTFLEENLGIAVEVVFEEGLALARGRMKEPPHLVIGKRSVVTFDSENESLPVRPLAALTGMDGAATLKGVFVVHRDSPAKTLADLAGRRIALGPIEDEEANGAARKAIESAGLKKGPNFSVSGSMDGAGLAVIDGEADAAVMSAFVPVIMAGCGKIEPGELRIIAETDPVPFVTLFATEALPAEAEPVLRSAFDAVARDADLLAALESKSGFIDPDGTNPPGDEGGWTDWRGPGRTGFSAHLPASLPEKPEILWSAPLTGPAVAGITATDQFVLVPDKSVDLIDDVLRCFDAATGREIWKLEYEAPGELDYSNAPRASAVIQENLVYLQGPFGELHCLELETGKVVWKRNLYVDFGATMLTWGASSPPLVWKDRLILNPGAPDASLVAVDRFTGRELWRTPGPPAAYSAFLAGDFGGVNQIVGYDSNSLGGWDPETGRRLWSHTPPDASDFNVTTPLRLPDGSLLLATENNGTRVHGFDEKGRLIPDPLASNFEMAPDTCSPVIAAGRVFASGYGELHCLDLANHLAPAWKIQNDLYFDHVSLIGGQDRVLVWTMGGDLLLLNAAATGYEVVSQLRPFGDRRFDTMSLPAVMPDRIYLRSDEALIAIRTR